MSTVRFERKELIDIKKKYALIRDCLLGERRIKERSVQYLPIPNESDEADACSKRYASYLKRAVFYNVTKRTLEGLCGQVFMREPVIAVPEVLDIVKEDADGAGTNIVGLAKKGAEYTIAYGRAGLFIDYPVVEGGATIDQIKSGDIRPTIALFAPDKILNWRTVKRGARTLLALVVLEETYYDQKDAFETRELTRWRVLRLENNVYTVELFQIPTNTDGSHGLGAPTNMGVKTTPQGPDGNPLDEIPFTFIGASNNDYIVDEPPMYDIATLNIGHYRNSADYEESVFIVGQPTPVFTGLTEDWVTNVLKGKVRLGARAAVSLPVGGDAKLLQAAPNSMPKEAMEHKEKQMVALGARLVEQKSVVRTATESGYDQATESSILTSVAQNVSAAFTYALKWCAFFVGAPDDKIFMHLNTDFDIATMSADDRRQLMAEWQGGGITWEEYRVNLRKAGIATENDEKARVTIDKELASIPGVVPAGGTPAKKPAGSGSGA